MESKEIISLISGGQNKVVPKRHHNYPLVLLAHSLLYAFCLSACSAGRKNTNLFKCAKGRCLWNPF